MFALKIRYAFEFLTNPIWKRDYDNFGIDEHLVRIVLILCFWLHLCIGFFPVLFTYRLINPLEYVWLQHIIETLKMKYKGEIFSKIKLPMLAVSSYGWPILISFNTNISEYNLMKLTYKIIFFGYHLFFRFCRLFLQQILRHWVCLKHWKNKGVAYPGMLMN